MKSRQTGFTIIELMVTLLVLSILLAAAVPTFREFTQNNRVIAIHNDLVTALNVARSEALKRSQPVSACASLDASTCATQDDWASGWIVFTDASGTAGDCDGTDEVLQQWSAAGGRVVVTADDASVQYQPTGMVVASRAFSVSWDGCKGEQLRSIGISMTGAISSQKSNCS